MANSLMNVVVLLPLTMLLLVPATLVTGQQQSPTSTDVSLQLSKQVFCSPNGNPVVDGIRNIVGAAKMNVSLNCDNNTIASAVSDNEGLVNINANLTTNPGGPLGALINGICQMIGYLPVDNCTALNHTGTLVAAVQFQSFVPGTRVMTASAGYFQVDATNI